MAGGSNFDAYIAELDGIIEKRAAAEEARLAGNELAGQVLGNPKATSGAGETQTDGHAADETDQESPQTEQHSDPSRSTSYQNAPQQDAKDDATTSGMNSEANKMARLSNDILSRIANIAGTGTKKAAGEELAKQVLSLIAKSAQEEEDKSEEEGNGEGEDEMTAEEEAEAEAAGAETEKEKRSYVMSKRAGAAAADALYERLHYVQQANLSKQAGYQVADQLIKQAQVEQAANLELAIRKVAAQAIQQEKIASSYGGNTSPAPYSWTGSKWVPNPEFFSR